LNALNECNFTIVNIRKYFGAPHTFDIYSPKNHIPHKMKNAGKLNEREQGQRYRDSIVSPKDSIDLNKKNGS